MVFDKVCMQDYQTICACQVNAAKTSWLFPLLITNWWLLHQTCFTLQNLQHTIALHYGSLMNSIIQRYARWRMLDQINGVFVKRLSIHRILQGSSRAAPPSSVRRDRHARTHALSWSARLCCAPSSGFLRMCDHSLFHIIGGKELVCMDRLTIVMMIETSIMPVEYSWKVWQE